MRQQVHKAKNTADKQRNTSIVAPVDSIYKKRQKTFSFMVSWQKQIKLYVSSQKGQ